MKRFTLYRAGEDYYRDYYRDPFLGEPKAAKKQAPAKAAKKQAPAKAAAEPVSDDPKADEQK